MTWGYPVWIYLWLAGMAGGAYFSAFLASRFGKYEDSRLLNISLYLSIPIAIIGVSFLLIDLSYPLRFWYLFINFNSSSPMSIGSWLLVAWITIGVLILLLWHTRRLIPIKQAVRKRITNILYWVDFFASMFLMSYTGVLLASSNQPLWSSTIILPILFVVSAVSTGIALLIFSYSITRMRRVYGDIIRRMVQIDVIIIIVELLILMGYLFWLSRSQVPGASESINQLISGSLAVPFWIGVVLLAIVFPFILEIIHWGKKAEENIIVCISSIAASALVIIGGLILRTVIVVGGQI